MTGDATGTPERRVCSFCAEPTDSRARSFTSDVTGCTVCDVCVLALYSAFLQVNQGRNPYINYTGVEH